MLTLLRGRAGEVGAAIAAVALLAVMVLTSWYGVAGVPDPSYARPAVSTVESGWDGLSDVRWVIVATAVAAVGSLLLHATQREHGVETDTGRVVAALGSLSAALLAYRVLVSLPGGGKVLDQKLGALIGLALALAIAWGGWETIGEQRTRAAAGGVTRARRRRRRADRAEAAPTVDGRDLGARDLDGPRGEASDPGHTLLRSR
ncbi:MAG: hypothetical protein ACRDLV_02295 [Solirubrobacteraceae bacterium]